MSQGRFEDLSGKTFGKLTVQYRAADHVQPSGQHKRVWHCKCECGNECDVRASDLKTGNTKSCGCFQESSRGQSSFEDLTGRQFGRLTVLYRLPNHVTPSGQKKVMWRCKCSCGNECDEYAAQLKKGLVLSCGCIAKEKREKKEEAKKIVSSGQTESVDELTDLFVKSFIKQRTRKKAIAAEKSTARRKQRLETDSLASKCPSLLVEWNYRLNGSLTPYDVTTGSGKIVWWKGSCGHEWKAVISSRVRGNGCPYCSSQKVLSGYNDLATLNPELAREWDYNKNGSLLPSEVAAHSGKKVWWICSKGHSYLSTVSNRERTGCPYCSVPAKKVLKGFNDLKSQYPLLAEEWHPEKNKPLEPDDVLCGSSKKVWWLGKCGHEFVQGISNRVSGSSCPYCSHQKLLQGFNDFATEHPELATEWDVEKNDCDPSEIMSHSHYKAWWICPFGHSYQAWMDNRCGGTRSGCPVCDKENHTSFPEQAVLYYLKKCFPDAINSDRSQIGMELDIFIPSINVAIEYDGRNWHRNAKFELKKNASCTEKEITLIRIREAGLPLYDDCKCFVREDARSDKSLSEVIVQVLSYLSSSADIDITRDSAQIYESYIQNRKTKSLQSCYPELAQEWHPTKNGSLTPEMVSPMTSKMVWWKGPCGHEWKMRIASRVGQKCGCPICSGQKIVSGINDLKTCYPELCEEWDYERNRAIELFPDKIAPHSDRKAWWKCKKCGNIWQSKIDGRTGMSAGCPKCGRDITAKAKHKAVRCVETKVEYASIKEAEEHTGINRNGISKCCKGKQKTAGKYHCQLFFRTFFSRPENI